MVTDQEIRESGAAPSDANRFAGWVPVDGGASYRYWDGTCYTTAAYPSGDGWRYVPCWHPATAADGRRASQARRARRPLRWWALAMWFVALSSCVPAGVAIPASVSECVDEAWTLRPGGVALLVVWWLAAIALAVHGQRLFRRREAELADDRSARRLLRIGIGVAVVGVPGMLLLVLLGIGANCGL